MRLKAYVPLRRLNVSRGRRGWRRDIHTHTHMCTRYTRWFTMYMMATMRDTRTSSGVSLKAPCISARECILPLSTSYRSHIIPRVCGKDRRGE